jgi:hypothetical protein
MDHVKVRFDESSRWLIVDRNRIRMMCNLGEAPVELENPGQYPLLLASRDGIEVRGEKVLLPPDSAAILSCEKIRDQSY